MNLLGDERRSFDDVLARLGSSQTSIEEADLLHPTHWSLGQDARLREDIRFRRTPWGRWIRSIDTLANDAVHRQLLSEERDSTDLPGALQSLEQRLGQRCVLCPADPRLQVVGTEVRLSASELSARPVLEHDIGPLQQYTSHLPLQSLKAAAASLPLGEWGDRAQQDVVEPLGWMTVRLSGGKRLSPRMFVAQITGHSMDNGTSGLADSTYVVFEFDDSDPFPNAATALVRGPSVDREFGSFVIKRVQPARNEQDETVRVTLVSLNPDKETYPDIGLEPGDEFELVARVVEPLSPGQFARVPKPKRRKGRRDIDSHAGLQQVHADLASKSQAFFDAPEAEQPTDEDEHPQTSACRTQLVCLEAKAGGVHLEIGPLRGLWKFVKVLVGAGATGVELRTLASNARLRPVQLPVNPGDGPWSWVAEDFEDDEDVDLSVLDQDGLSREGVTVFRVGSDGVGRALTGTSVSPGQHYRIVVPPAVPDERLHALPSIAMTGGWHMVELDLPTDLPAALTTALEALGLTVGDPTPSLRFGIASWPDTWRTNHKGNPYAAFRAPRPESVFLDVQGYDAEVAGEATLFLHGPDGTKRLPLPAGRTSRVELSDLEDGRYLCALLHQRTSVAPSYLAFEVTTDIAGPPAAAWTLTCADEPLGAGPGAVVVPARDLGQWDELEWGLEGPPGWEMRVLWREVARDYLGRLTLDESGGLDTTQLLNLTRDRRTRRLVGDLEVDLGELGVVRLRHDRRRTPEEVEQALREFVESDSRRRMVERRAGAYAHLIPTWFHPICECFGYELGEMVEDESDSPPWHAAAVPLRTTDRLLDGGFEREDIRMLILVEQVQQEMPAEARSWMDRVCRAHGTREALVSNGIQWGRYHRRMQVAMRTWDLVKVLDGEDDLDAFLRNVVEWG
ncbi:MAG: hypothetical protein H6739_06305 [Alphaproteobacteria bacterium]|nr:hypothetical protein [Alphaproteobacteria bacterium]